MHAMGLPMRARRRRYAMPFPPPPDPSPTPAHLQLPSVVTFRGRGCQAGAPMRRRAASSERGNTGASTEVTERMGEGWRATACCCAAAHTFLPTCLAGAISSRLPGLPGREPFTTRAPFSASTASTSTFRSLARTLPICNARMQLQGPPAVSGRCVRAGRGWGVRGQHSGPRCARVQTAAEQRPVRGGYRALSAVQRALQLSCRRHPLCPYAVSKMLAKQSPVSAPGRLP